MAQLGKTVKGRNAKKDGDKKKNTAEQALQERIARMREADFRKKLAQQQKAELKRRLELEQKFSRRNMLMIQHQ